MFLRHNKIYLYAEFSPADLVLYCEAFLTTYRTFITPEELIEKLQYRYPFHMARNHHTGCDIVIVVFNG